MMEDTLSSLKAQMGHVFQDEPEPQGWWEELTASLQLSFAKRVALFALFMGLGLLLAGLSTMFILSPTKFAKLYTFGSIFITTGSLFLVGPTRQLRAIAQDASRSVAAIIYVASMALTLYAALGIHSASLTTFFVVVQFGAAIWYGASYIPFAQSCLRTTARTILPI